MSTQSQVGQYLRALTMIRDNPFLVEVRWRTRKFLLGRPPMQGTGVPAKPISIKGIVLGLLAIVVAFLLWGFYNRLTFPPSVVCFPFLTLVTVLSPLSVYQAFAAERERRTWEFLLVSPRSNAEIVLGRVAAPIISLLFFTGLALVGVLVLWLLESLNPTAVSTLPLTRYFASLSMGFGLGVFLIGLGALISATSRRALASLGISAFLEALLLVIIPVAIGLLLQGTLSTEEVFYFHPWVGSAVLLQETPSLASSTVLTTIFAYPAVCLLFFFLFTYLASRVLRHVDQKPTSS